MVKEIEKTGLPVVHMCTVVPISLTVGANRIVPTIAIPHPLGNPALDPTEEKALRRGLVEKALNEFMPLIQSVIQQEIKKAVAENND